MSRNSRELWSDVMEIPVQVSKHLHVDSEGQAWVLELVIGLNGEVLNQTFRVMQEIDGNVEELEEMVFEKAEVFFEV